jgi:hypothetical protein
MVAITIDPDLLRSSQLLISLLIPSSHTGCIYILLRLRKSVVQESMFARQTRFSSDTLSETGEVTFWHHATAAAEPSTSRVESSQSVDSEF